MKGKPYLILAIFLVIIMVLSSCGSGGGDGGSSGEGETIEDTSGGDEENNDGNNNGDLTISNHFTGLKWENLPTPHIKVTWYKASGIYDSRYNPDSEDICAECRTGNDGSIWRLPTKDELLTLYQYIHEDYFNCEEARYWAASSLAEVIDFEDGQVKPDYKSQENYVRCVQSILKTVKGNIDPPYFYGSIKIGDRVTNPRNGKYVFENIHITQSNNTINTDPFVDHLGAYWQSYRGTIEITASDTLYHDINLSRLSRLK